MVCGFEKCELVERCGGTMAGGGGRGERRARGGKDGEGGRINGFECV